MDGPTTAPLKWLFERCVFEDATLELSLDGVVVELERKPLEVLRHLLRHAGEVVTKEELHAAVWPGRIVSETVLTKAISRIREVLADDAQTLIKTVHGYGYRLIAPVRVEAATSPAAPDVVLGLKAGDSPPLRAQWQLAEHLGSGGSGEVWRVVHRKTRDVRVYKFAINAEALNALKREITLFRLLRQQLGTDAPIAEMLDWNLEDAPYFIELEHYPSGNLLDWASARGGLSQIPLDQRLAVFADLAEALGRVHGVGVLHKDLKASNILMHQQGTSVRPLLADFGGGGVLADEVIENAGITRMGFTQRLSGSGQGTALYVAPEVLEGQPQTIRGDIYALGVLLYQMCVGDFRKPISPGWEIGVTDELLRLDIAEAVQGNPERRLSSAQALAERIRGLETRRLSLAAERQLQREQIEATAAAEVANRKVEQLRVRRTWLLAVSGILLLGLGASLALYRQAVQAREDAEQARSVSEAVSNFLNYDVLSATEQEGRDTRKLTAQQLLDDAGKRIDARFVDQPEAGARVHAALSSSYMQIGDTAAAIFHRGRGWDISKSLLAGDPEAALRLAVELAPVDFNRDEDAAFWVAMRGVAERRWGAKDQRTLLLRNAVALTLSRQRRPQLSADLYVGIIRDAEQIVGYDAETLATHWEDLGLEQASLARFADAEQSYAKALAIYDSLYGAKSFAAATAKIRYARLLMTTGREAEAEVQLQQALDASRAQRNGHNALVIAAQRWFASLRIQQGRLAEAEAMINEVRAAETAARGLLSQQVVHTGYLTAQVREQQQRFSEAEQLIRDALAAQHQVPVVLLYGERRKEADRVAYSLLLTRVLAAQGRAAEARSVFAALGKTALESTWLSPIDEAESLRTEGLLLKAEGQMAAAAAVLQKAADFSEKLLGPGHRATQVMRSDVNRLVPRAVASPGANTH